MPKFSETDPTAPSKLKIAVFGKNQSGKSLFGMTSPDGSEVLNFEGGVRALAKDRGLRVGLIEPEVNEDILDCYRETIEDFRKGKFGVRSLFIDSWNCIEDAARARGPKGSDPRELGRLNDQIQQLIRPLCGEFPGHLIVATQEGNDWSAGVTNGPVGVQADAMKTFGHPFDLIFGLSFDAKAKTFKAVVKKSRFRTAFPIGRELPGLSWASLQAIISGAVTQTTISLKTIFELYNQKRLPEGGFLGWLTANGLPSEQEALKALDDRGRQVIIDKLDAVVATVSAIASPQEAPIALPEIAPQAHLETKPGAATMPVGLAPCDAPSDERAVTKEDLIGLHTLAGAPEGTLGRWFVAAGFPVSKDTGPTTAMKREAYNMLQGYIHSQRNLSAGEEVPLVRRSEAPAVVAPEQAAQSAGSLTPAQATRQNMVEKVAKSQGLGAKELAEFASEASCNKTTNYQDLEGKQFSTFIGLLSAVKAS